MKIKYVDVIKDNELKDTLTNYIVYADFVGKKDNRRCTKCYDATEVLIATKKYDEMGSCHIAIKLGKEFSKRWNFENQIKGNEQ